MNNNLENIQMTQCEVLLTIMYKNPQKKVWYAKDFQHEPYYIGYEATARMSDLVRMYPELFLVGKDGRYRTLELDLRQEPRIKEIIGVTDEK